MKNQIIKKVVSTCLLLATTAAVSQAQNGTWTGADANALWSDPNNWSSMAAPGAGNTATFNNVGTGGITTIDLGTGVTIGGIIFDTANAAPYTIGVSGLEVLTLNDFGTVSMTSTVVQNQTFNAQILLGTATAAGYTFTNAGTATLTLAGNIQGGIGGTASTKTLELAGNTLVSGVIANGGASALALQQAGVGTTATLTATNTFTGGITNITGTLVIGGAGLLQSGATPAAYAGAITNNGTFIYASSSRQTNTGLMYGTGAMVVNGPGTLALGASPSLYSGTTTVNGGFLQINSASGGNGFSENSALTINPGGELDLNASDCLGYSLASPFTNGGIVKKLANQSETFGRPMYLTNGSLVTTLTNVEQFEFFNNFIATFPNTTNYFSGPGKFGFRVPSCYFNLAANSYIIFNLAVDQNVNNAAGGLNMTGPGTIILNGTNTWSGNTTVSNGTLIIAGSGTLGAGAYPGVISNFSTIQYNSSANDYLAGMITGTGAIVVNGPGTLGVAGTNNYTGVTTVNGGTFEVYSSQPNTSPIVVNDGGVLGVVASGGGSFSPSSLSLGSASGATLLLSINSTNQSPLTPAILNLTGNNTLKIVGNLVAGASYPLITYGTSTGTGNLNQLVLPNGLTGSIVRFAGRTYVLEVSSVADTFWNSLVNGTWDINLTANWAAPGGGSTYLDGSPVVFDDNDNTGGSFMVTNLLPVVVSPSTVIISNSTHNYFFGTNVVISGAAGLIKTGSGNVTLSNLNTYTGPTIISQGSIIAGVAANGVSPFGLNSAVSLSNFAGATMNLNNFSQQIGSLSGGGAAGGNVVMGSGSLTVGGDNSSQTFAGTISGTGGMNKIGTGSLTLTGVNAFTGAISGITGTLALGGAGSLNGGTYAGTIADNGTFLYGSSAVQTNTAVMSGTGALTVNGPGNLFINGAPNTYSGLTTVNGGILTINGTSGGNGGVENSTIIINPGGELDLNVNDALGYSINLPVTNSGVIKKLNSQAETLNRPLYLSNGTLLTTLSGVQQFETFGNFIQTLAGTANFVNGPGFLGVRTVSCYIGVATNSTLTFNAGINNYTAGTPLNIHGPGTVILANANTFTGGINSSGTILLTNSGTLGSGTYAGNITNNGTLIYGGAGAQAFSGVVSGVGGILDVTGPGALTLSGVETYNGPTIVAGGDLLLTGSASLNSTASITVSNGATFDVSGLSSTFGLGGSQSLLVNGIVNGSVNAAAGAKVYGDAGAGYGTNTFNNNLTMAANSTFSLKVGPTYNGANDKIVVTGQLTVNGNIIHLSAPSPTASLDSSGYPYLLISTPNAAVSGTFNPAVTWDAPPANQAHYSLAVSNNDVFLIYNNTAAATLAGTAAPATAVRNEGVFVSATVTPGAGIVTNVTLNLAPIGGSSAFPLVASAVANVYTNTFIIPPSAPVGLQALVATATDTTPLSGSGNIALTIVASTETWDGLGLNQDWDTNGNWLSGFAPGYVGDTLVFAGSTALGPVMDNNYTVNGLTFSNTAGAFTLNDLGSSTLTIQGGAGVTNNSASAQTIQAPVALGGAVTLNAAAGNLALNLPVSEAISGAGALTSAGVHTNTLMGVNTFSGGTFITSNNTLVIGGAGVLDDGLYSAAISNNGTFNYNSSATETNSGIMAGTGGLTVSGSGTLAIGSSPNLYFGPTTVNAGILLVNSASGGNGFTQNSTNLTIGPAGEVDLNASDALGYSLNSSITNFGIIKKLVNQAETLFRPIYLSGGSLVTTLAGDQQFESYGGFIQTLPNSANYVSGPGSFGLRTATCYLGVAANSTLNFSAPIIQNANGTLTPLNFGGPGTLILSGANSFAGNIVISNNGSLLLADPGQLAGGAYAGTIADGGAFIDSSTSGQVLTGAISGPGALEVNGNGGYVSLTLATVETYAGPTIVVSNGYLTMAAGSSILNSFGIYVGSGATLDGSALTGFSLNGNQTLMGSGSIVGSLGTTPDTIIYPGSSTNGVFGTLTFNGNLTNAIGATESFALGSLTTADGGTNDQIVVNGTLVISGNNAVHIRAPSTTANLDINNDYVLFTTGGFQGSFSSTPIWDVRPANSINYTVETGPAIAPNSVILHYATATPPVATGTATPSLGVLRNETILLTVTVTANNPLVAKVTVDASPIGGSVITLVPTSSANIYTNSIVIPAATGPGPENLTATITELQSGPSATVPITFTVVTSTEKWNGSGPDANFDDNMNWVSKSSPGYVGDSLIFAGSADLTPLMDQSYTVGGLGFDSTAGAFDIGGAGTTLTVTSGVTNNSANAQTLNVPILLGANAVLDAATTNLVLAQSVTVNGALTKAGPGTVYFTTSNPSFTGYAGATLLNGGTLDFDTPDNLLLPGLISGPGSLTLDGTGDVTLTNNDTYTGGTIVNNGTLTLAVGGSAGSILGTLIITTNGTVNLTVRDGIGYGAGTSVTNLIIDGGTFNMAQDNAGFITQVSMTGGMISDAGAPLGALFNFSSGYNLTTYACSTPAIVSAGIDLRGTNLLITTALGAAPDGADLIVSGIIGNSNNTVGVASLTKLGPGKAVFQGYSTYPGTTTIAGGALEADASENFGISGPFGVNTAVGAIAFAGGTLQYSDQNQYDYSGRFSTAAGQPVSIDTSNQYIIFSTPLTSSGGSLTKLGLGTLVLGAGNTYSGATTISQGALVLASGSFLSSASSISIGAGGVFDVSALPSYTLGSSASLTAGGTSSVAAINGSSGEAVSLGSQPITLNFDGTDPALTVSNAILSLDANAFTINGSQLAAGSYVVVTQTLGNITSAGTYTVNGTVIGPGFTASIAVNGGQVVLTVKGSAILPPSDITYIVSSGTLSLTWPQSNLGWSLQSNSISLANHSDWFDIAGSALVTNVSITINKSGPPVFFRLLAP